MGRVVGIDLGTTNTVVACLKMGGVEVLPNKEGEYITRSIVSSYKGDIQVGRVAYNRWQLAPADTIVSVKRLMGRAFSDKEVRELTQRHFYYRVVPAEDGSEQSLRVVMEGKLYSPVDISAFILEKVKKDAEMRLGEEVTHAVITVPAYFSDRQRQATIEAGRRAGLTVMRLLDEPVAAAIAYGIENPSREPKNVLVYDLGGGTFDVTIMAVMEGNFVELVKEGDMWLGGDDFDQALFDYVLEQSGDELKEAVRNDVRAAIDIRKACQQAKEALSSSEFTEIIIPACTRDQRGNPIDVLVEVTRSEFEEMTCHLVKKSVELVKKAVANAYLEVGDIDYVVMAGSASSMPHVYREMVRLFGREKVKTGVHPKHCVAMGAAIAAAQLNSVMCPSCSRLNEMGALFCEGCGFELAGKGKALCPSCGSPNSPAAERCSRCGAFMLGMSSVEGGITGFYYGIVTEGGVRHIYVNKGDTYATPEENRISRMFSTRFDHQTFISVPVWRAEEEDSLEVETVGEAIVLMPFGTQAGSRVKVSLWLNADGYFELEAFAEGGQRLPVAILRWNRMDSKAMRILEECSCMISEQEKDFDSNLKREVREKQLEILKELEKDRVYNAEILAEELEKAVLERNTRDAAQRVENACWLAEHVVSEYDWLLNKDIVYEITGRANQVRSLWRNGKAEEAVRQADSLRDFVLNLFYTPDKRSFSLLGWFMHSRVMIAKDIRPYNQAAAYKLEQELYAVREKVKAGDRDINERIRNFNENLQREYEALVSMGVKASWQCPRCKTSNEPGSRYCRSCGSDLWLLKAF